MQNGQFLFTILGSLLAIIAICNIDKKKSVEGFWNGIAFTSNAVPVVKNVSGTRGSNLQGMSSSPLPVKRSSMNMAQASAPKMLNSLQASPRQWGTEIGGTTLNDMPQNNFYKPGPNLQSMVPPRAMNINTGSLIRYSPPDIKHMAGDSQNPMIGGCGSKSVSEGYCASGGCSSDVGGVSGPKCGTGGIGPSKVGKDALLPNPSYTNGNYADVLGQIPFQAITDEIAVGEMTIEDPDGNMEQVVNYDQFMVANLKSRIRAQADPIRGDVAVVPYQVPGGWFNTYPNISQQFQQGAMNVMAGEGAVDPASAILYSSAKGGNLGHFAGATLNKPIVQTAQNMATATAGGSDVANTPNMQTAGYF